MTVKKILGMTFLATMVLSQSVMAMPNEETSEITQIDILENISKVYIEEEQEVIAAESALSEELKAMGTITKVIVEEAKVRESASEEADIINYLTEAQEVVAIERLDNWYLVKTEEIEGYVYKTQIDETELSMIPYIRTEENELPQQTYLGEEVVSYAKQFLGNPYVYGGNSLTKGTDCSGFTSQVYKNFDIKLQRSSRAQYASNGYKVSKKDLLPGDLVFYGYNGYIDHVAIYAGNGEIVHASTPKTGIKMSKLEYGKPIIGIKRVI